MDNIKVDYDGMAISCDCIFSEIDLSSLSESQKKKYAELLRYVESNFEKDEIQLKDGLQLLAKFDLGDVVERGFHESVKKQKRESLIFGAIGAGVGLLIANVFPNSIIDDFAGLFIAGQSAISGVYEHLKANSVKNYVLNYLRN